jgi:hypothetical protein
MPGYFNGIQEISPPMTATVVPTTPGEDLYSYCQGSGTTYLYWSVAYNGCGAGIRLAYPSPGCNSPQSYSSLCGYDTLPLCYFLPYAGIPLDMSYEEILALPPSLPGLDGCKPGMRHWQLGQICGLPLADVECVSFDPPIHVAEIPDLDPSCCGSPFPDGDTWTVTL